jgi:hypothetical protein
MNSLAIGRDWEDPGPYAVIATHGRTGLAWEVLRRNPAYQAAYATLQHGLGSVDSAFVARWGLHFR